MTLYIIKGCVTCPDVAAILSDKEGREIKLGDDEFRVCDDPDTPSYSYDYGSLAMARRDYPQAIVCC